MTAKLEYQETQFLTGLGHVVEGGEIFGAEVGGVTDELEPEGHRREGAFMSWAIVRSGRSTPAPLPAPF